MFKRNLLVASLLSISASAQATNGYFMHGNSITSQGMAGTGFALSHDGIQAVSNPAALVKTEDRLDVGLNLFAPDRSSKVSGNTNNLDGSYDANGTSIFFIPQIGLVRTYSDKLTYGLAMYGNGGMNTTYKTNPFGAIGGVGAAGVDLGQLYITGSLGIKVDDKSTIGIGVTHVYQRFSAEGIQPFKNMSSDNTAVTNRGYDSGTGWGLKLGWQGQISDALRLGVNWSSKVNVSEFKKYRGLFAEQGSFDVPSSYGAGFALKMNPQLTLAGDWERINYSEVQAISNPLNNVALGANGGAGFGWQDMDIYKLGLSYQASDKLTLRAGYSHTDQPIPNSQTFFNILAPAVVEDHLSVGGTWKISPKHSLTFAYTRALENSVKGNNSIPASYGSGEANLEMSQDILGIAWHYNW